MPWEYPWLYAVAVHCLKEVIARLTLLTSSSAVQGQNKYILCRLSVYPAWSDWRLLLLHQGSLHCVQNNHAIPYI